ncbi:MAG TPA: hypothetical protein VKA46_15915 [Gemmataceae bacterium]|nr:hypothetical protein [Gemmataceae bacterium]
MNFCVRTLSCVALLGMSLTALGQYRPAWAARLGLDWWSLPELQERVRRGEQEMAEMDPRLDAAAARMAAKEQTTQDLLAGRLTLLQAAARFRAHNASPPRLAADLADHIAGATEEERLCRQVIGWAKGAAATTSPGAGERTRQRLEAELAGLLAQNNGIIRLPE